MLLRYDVIKCVVFLYIISAVTSERHRARNFRTELPDDDVTSDVDTDELDPEEILNLSANSEELERYRRKQIDPKGSWLTFVRYSDDRTPDRKTDRRKKKRSRKRSKTLHGPPGPQGPTGPAGPPGPPGAAVSKEEILEDLKELIKETAEKRAQEILAEMGLVNSSSIPLQDSAAYLMSVPRISAGFSMRLSQKALILRKTFMEIKSFKLPFGSGAFQRGDVFNAKEGRFVAPRDGIFQFAANLHVRVRSKRKPVGRIKRDDHVKVVICINSLCLTNASLETVSGIESNSKVFTVSVAGILQLKEKEYASLYIDNSSAYNTVVLPGSHFSGVLLGE